VVKKVVKEQKVVVEIVAIIVVEITVVLDQEESNYN
jgi:hypothetical protein